MAGRFAPSPTSDLHLGNLRTALVAWLMARSTGRRFVMRVEDLDAQRVAAAGDAERRQLRDLAELGLDWDGPVVRQSDRLHLYERAAAELPTYECFCTRREIAEAASAPHEDGFRPYGGTCLRLSASERASRRAVRAPALRVAAGGASGSGRDVWAGLVEGEVDDFVIRRGDGAWAYNLAVVVDDLDQGVDQVVRGADLLTSVPRQAWLTEQLGGTVASYGHVPLVLNRGGQRLAKRDKAVTLAELKGLGWTPTRVLTLLGHSLGLNEVDEPVTTATLLDRWRTPTVRSLVYPPPHQTG